ncbi:membrane protein insertion efficiency factor YidD [Yinghuangia seranimata]|uniref:membrane protein insertion efficiency factor YidD n=1 Tax=Yinghuangia seranimata TaxID=408067 RepID=UPI00248BBB63|nr:membrane protein insertion efficiency factor YidD [Yinghuangia seranimata]MDI2125154.1 membrane protein insertion efficiency factor YidD [Yinghuangia seranimata]
MLVLPVVVLWSALRALVGRPGRRPVATLSAVDRAEPEGRAARTLFRAVRWYRLSVSPRTEPVCRYTPTCSTYAATALTRHGALRGSRLAARRLSRCNRHHPGGHDPVPS